MSHVRCRRWGGFESVTWLIHGLELEPSQAGGQSPNTNKFPHAHTCNACFSGTGSGLTVCRDACGRPAFLQPHEWSGMRFRLVPCFNTRDAADVFHEAVWSGYCMITSPPLSSNSQSHVEHLQIHRHAPAWQAPRYTNASAEASLLGLCSSFSYLKVKDLLSMLDFTSVRGQILTEEAFALMLL